MASDTSPSIGSIASPMSQQQHVGMFQLMIRKPLVFPLKKNSLINFGSQLEVPFSAIPTHPAAMVEGLQLAPQKLRDTLEVKFHNSSWHDIIVEKYHLYFLAV